MLANKPTLWKFTFAILIGLGVVFYLATPKPKLLERYTYSTAVYDKDKKLLNLSLSMDDKYRLFLPYEQIPPKAIEALLLYEDRHFFYHFGINPLRTFKATVAMLFGSRKQGASTISMQLARIVYNINSSSIAGKFEQMARAVQIEMFYTKEEILEAYFNLAPYGQNIEGIAAASLIFFNSRAENLNIEQIVALTTVPQNPNKRNLGKDAGKHEVILASKRLKQTCLEEHKEDATFFDLPLYTTLNKPFYAPHLVVQLKSTNSGEVVSTIDLNYQFWLEEIVRKYVNDKKSLGIENAAVLIVNHKDMSLLAKVGSNNFFNNDISGQVDGTRAYRSPGSVMKPFIYAMALEEGIIHPRSRLKDVPRNFSNYLPENYDRSFYGMIDATSSLIKSRNVPAVDLLLSIGLERYYNLLLKSGVKKLKTAQHYGLALALGGYELTMENVAEMYAMLANYGKFRKIRLLQNTSLQDGSAFISPEAAFLTMNMLAKNPPPDESYHNSMLVDKKYNIYWKTGTSFGYKDAWSAGVVGDYVVVVWVGNFDARSNNSLVGQEMAAPLFFQIVRGLAKNRAIVGDDISANGLNVALVDICRSTGDIATADCSKTSSSYFIPGVTRIQSSNISRKIPIYVQSGKRACRHRPPLTVMKSFEFWPTDVLAAYRAAGAHISMPPDFAEDCENIQAAHTGKAPLILFPAAGSRFVVTPEEMEKEKISLKASIDADAKKIFWFVNGRLVGHCAPDESLQTTPQMGEMEIKAVDDIGRFSSVKIFVKPTMSD